MQKVPRSKPRTSREELAAVSQPTHMYISGEGV